MEHTRMIRQLGIELFEDSSASKFMCEGSIGRSPQRRQGVGVKCLGLAILGIFSMELLQGICIGTHARSVIKRVRALVEDFNRCNVIAFACVFPADGFGIFECLLSLYRHWSGP